MARIWQDIKNDMLDWIDENDHIGEIEKSECKSFAEKQFKLMRETFGSFELIRHRAEQGDLKL